MADWDTNSPQDSDFVSQFPNNERAARSAVATNFAVDHREVNDANVGKHKQVSLLPRATHPNTGGNGSVYIMDVDGTMELFYRDSTNTSIQLSSLGNRPPLSAQTLSVTGLSGDVTPNAQQLAARAIRLFNTPSGNITLVLPSIGNRIYDVINAMSGSFSAHVRLADGSNTVFVPPQGTVTIMVMGAVTTPLVYDHMRGTYTHVVTQANAGASTIAVANGNGFFVGEEIITVMDNGSGFSATITGISGNNISISPSVPGGRFLPVRAFFRSNINLSAPAQARWAINVVEREIPRLALAERSERIVTDALNPSYTASDAFYAFAALRTWEYSPSGGSGALDPIIMMRGSIPYDGEIRFHAEHRAVGSGSTRSNVRFRVNGSNVSTQQAGNTFLTHQHDQAVSKGDIVEIQVQKSNGTLPCEARNIWIGTSSPMMHIHPIMGDSYGDFTF